MNKKQQKIAESGTTEQIDCADSISAIRFEK